MAWACHHARLKPPSRRTQAALLREIEGLKSAASRSEPRLEPPIPAPRAEGMENASNEDLRRCLAALGYSTKNDDRAFLEETVSLKAGRPSSPSP